MKESAGAIKRAKDGGYIHLLVDDTLASPTICPRTQSRSSEGRANTISEQITPLAPLEIRDAAYRKLIELSPAWKYEHALVTAVPDGLLTRGLRRKDVARFGALPSIVEERDWLAATITRFIEDEFPAYTKDRGLTAGTLGVPGFWEGAEGQIKLGKDFNYRKPALVIPYRDEQGLIQACQLRPAGAASDYHWLSTSADRLNEEPKGTSSGSPIHWTAPPEETSSVKDLPILITEGALKAELFVRLRPPMRAIATAGVGVAHAEIIQALSGRDAVIGFDSDHRQNEQVCRQLGKLVALREMDAEANGLKNTTGVVVWEGPKGIDDAVKANVRIRVLSIADWFTTLTGKNLEEVEDVWC